MEMFDSLWRAVALGATAGVFIGVANMARKRRRPPPDDRKQKRQENFGRGLMRVMSKGVYMVLAVALIWTIYFLGVGLVDPARTGYAADAASLIVSVVTVFSIMIAFYEFTNKNKE